MLGMSSPRTSLMSATAAESLRKTNHFLYYNTVIRYSELNARAITAAMTSPKAFNILSPDLKGPTDSVTLITGGAAGIGLQTALLLHDICPKNRIIILDRHQPNLQQAPEQFIKSNRVLALQCDLTNWTSQREAFEAGIQRFGTIDNVFVNAGIAEYKDQFFEDELDEQGKLKEPDRRVYDVDLAAANDTLKLAIHHMRKNRNGKTGGNVVLTASLAGYLASAGAPLYSAAKHGSFALFCLVFRPFHLRVLSHSCCNSEVKQLANIHSMKSTRLCPFVTNVPADRKRTRHRRPHESSQERHSNSRHRRLRCCSRYYAHRSCFRPRPWRITLRLGKTYAWSRCPNQQPCRGCSGRGVVDELGHRSQWEGPPRASGQGCGCRGGNREEQEGLDGN